MISKLNYLKFLDVNLKKKIPQGQEVVQREKREEEGEEEGGRDEEEEEEAKW